MPLWEDPPHTIDLHSVASGGDTGGGVKLTYSTNPVQADVPCSIATADAKTVARFAQDQIEVTHTIGILTSKLTAAVERGWKAVAGDTGASFHIEGIAPGRAYGNVPAFTYLHVRELL